LKRKGFPEEVVEQVKERLKELSYLDDVHFAREWITSRCQRGNGSLKLKQELLQKGIGREIIEEQLQQCLPEEDEIYYATRLLDKKIKQESNYYYGKDNYPLLKKFSGYLAGRGYNGAVINKAINHCFYSES